MLKYRFENRWVGLRSLIRIYRRQSGANGMERSQRRTCGTNEKLGTIPHKSCVGHIDGRSNSPLKAVIAGIGNDADDLTPLTALGRSSG
jgi:hypothetical protein